MTKPKAKNQNPDAAASQEEALSAAVAQRIGQAAQRQPVGRVGRFGEGLVAAVAGLVNLVYSQWYWKPGLALGLAADVIVIARESRYGLTFMEHGITPGMGTTARWISGCVKRGRSRKSFSE